MNEITEILFIVGCGFIPIGILLIIFNKPIGINFCKIGKSIFNLKTSKRINPFGTKITEYVYDEKKAPRIMKFIGIVIIVQGGLFVLISLIANLFNK